MKTRGCRRVFPDFLRKGIAQGVDSLRTQRLQEQEELESLLARLRTRLTDREYRVLLLRLSDCSYAEIAARLGITVKAVDNAIQRIRRKMA